MSALADQPLDFVRWLQGRPESRLGGVVPTETTFAPRGLYGAYLQHLLERGVLGQRSCRLELVDDQATGIDSSRDRVMVLLASGAVAPADLAVLAVGLPHSAAFHPDIPVLEAAGLWRRDPWTPDAYAALNPAAPVLLVGSGLTMVDTVISLLDAGHTGPIQAVSRHGLLPRRHATRPSAPIALPSLPKGLLPLVRSLRVEAAGTTDWRAVIDALRPIVPELWRSLSEQEQRRFVRHLRAFWDVHRHRMAPQIAARIDAAQASGQLRLCAGRVVDMAVDCGLAKVRVRWRSGWDPETLTVARVIDCTGPGCDISSTTTPLLRNLFKSGVARPDRLRLGLEVTEEGALVSAGGVVSQRLFAVGPLTRGRAWELTAVPELRRQCLDTARVLGGHLARVAARSPLTGEIAPWLSQLNAMSSPQIGPSGEN